MRFELVPVLEKLRELYTLPRGPERFGAYIHLTVGGAQKTADVALPPLVMANPMAKESVLTFVEAWLELGAESVAAEVLEEATTRLEALPFARTVNTVNTVKVGLTVLDDAGGGWTNRTMNDAARFQTGKSITKTGWVSVNLWTSETPSSKELRRVVLEAAHRAAQAQQGDPHTLGEMMRQEGLASAFAGRTVTLDAEDLEYSRAAVEPHRSSTQQPTVIACLYGDDAARACGYAPLGLSKNAGFQVGLADALEPHRGVLT